MINLNINFYLMKTIFYSYLFLYIRTAKCVVIMLRNEFIWFKRTIHLCNLRARNRQTKLSCWFTATYHFHTRQTWVGKLGNKWGIIPQKLGKCKNQAFPVLDWAFGNALFLWVILNNLPRWRDNEKMFAFKHVCMQTCLKANRL